MPVNTVNMTLPSTPAQIEMRKSLAKQLMGGAQDQTVKHPLQGLSNVAGRVSGMVLNRRASRDEEARRQALASQLGGWTPQGVDQNIWGTYAQNNPEEAIGFALEQQAAQAQAQAEAERAAAQKQAEQDWWFQQQEYQNQQDRVERLSPEESAQLGLPEGTIAQRDANGNISIVREPPKASDPWTKLDDNTLFRQDTGETRDIGPTGGDPSGFRFGGNSIEGQSLNHLMDIGALTPEQAAQVGGGKTITGQNGEIIFMTPQGVFSQQPGQPPQPVPTPPMQDGGGQPPMGGAQPGPAQPQMPSSRLMDPNPMAGQSPVMPQGMPQQPTQAPPRPPVPPGQPVSAPPAMAPQGQPQAPQQQSQAPNQRPGMFPLTTPKEKPSAGQDAIDTQFAKDYADWIAGGDASDTMKQIAQLEATLNTLRSGNDNITGPLVGSLPDSVNAWINPKSIEERERVEEVAQRNLRQILGGQFAAKEGEQLIARAFNPRLQEDVNARRVEALIQQMKLAAQQKADAARYFEQNGTLKGWEGSLPSMDDFTSIFDDGEKDGENKRLRFNPETGELE